MRWYKSMWTFTLCCHVSKTLFSRHRAVMANTHLPLHLNFSPLLIFVSFWLLLWTHSCQNTMSHHHVVWANGCVSLRALRCREANSLTSIKWCFYSTDFQLCGPLPASSCFKVKLQLLKALRIIEKYFDALQVCILKTFLIKICPSCCQCNVNPAWVPTTVTAAWLLSTSTALWQV